MASLANLWLPCAVGLAACALVAVVIGKPWERRRPRDDAPEEPPRGPDAS